MASVMSVAASARVVVPTRASARRASSSSAAAPRHAASLSSRTRSTLAINRKARVQDRRLVVRAEGKTSVAAVASADTFSEVCTNEDLPRGDRKKFNALGKSVLLFWYRENLCCIESRSPAEGAFSEGFENARLTQDGCITCPATMSTFDLQTGEIKEWYPDNPVLRRLTPIETCRPMEVFPVKVEDEKIFVDFKNGSLGAGFVAPSTMGGSDTSLENNNVYAVEPRVYVEGQEDMDVDDFDPKMAKMNPGTVAVSIAGVGLLAVGGTATCVFYQNWIALGVFWIAGFAAAAKVTLDVTGAMDEE